MKNSSNALASISFGVGIVLILISIIGLLRAESLLSLAPSGLEGVGLLFYGIFYKNNAPQNEKAQQALNIGAVLIIIAAAITLLRMFYR